MEDRELATAAAKGDQDAFALLLERNRSFIYSIAWKIALHEDDALDITQNVFLRLAEKIGAFSGSGAFRGWVATIAAREAISYLRHPSRKEQASEPSILNEMPDSGNGGPHEKLINSLEREDRLRIVEKAMAQLPPQQRAIFTLRFSEDMLPAEIAQRLGLPSHQVRSQLHNAVDRIRNIVSNEQNRLAQLAPKRRSV